MKIQLLAILSTAVLAGGCSTRATLPPASPAPTVTVPALPTTTKETQTTIIPELVLDIENESDPLKTPYGIAVDSSGNVYVNDAGNSRILVFDTAGSLLAKWDRQGSGEGEFHSFGFGGIAIDENDNVFVVDNGNHRIQKFDRAGNFLTQWGSAGRQENQFVRAIGIAVDSEGNVYVTDDGNPFVQKFDNNGRLLLRWGGAGTGDGQFRHATGIAVDSQGNVFVCDYANKRVQKFDGRGDFSAAWSMGAEIGIPGIPEGVAVDAQNRVYVTDYELGRIQVFDHDGNWLATWGTESLANRFFQRPVAIAFDTLGHVYVVNQATGHILKFDLP